MKLIKIDPQNRTVEVIDSVGTLNALCILIDCRLIDVCARQDNGDALVVDDESLYLEPQPDAFRYKDYPYPIHGTAILTGSDEEGETVEPATTLAEVIQNVTWLGSIHTRP